jgi:acetylornithine/N-succinyldiaminopimelate aminotransferase
MPLPHTKRLEEEHLLQTYSRYDLLVGRGSGVYLFDKNNKRYLDLLAGIGVNALGYSHPRMLRVLRKQIKRPLHVSNLLYHEYQGRLAGRLAQISGLDQVFFCNSGTESVEGCLKLARAHAKRTLKETRNRILALEGSFHGRTLGALSATHAARYRTPFEPLLPDFEFVRFNDPEDLRRRYAGDVCAIILETVQGEGGIRPISEAFYGTARQLTLEHGALLIADEVQCGLGRTGTWLACHRFAPPDEPKTLPDLVALAKPLGGGLPLGAVLLKKAIAAAIEPGFHGSTFGGGPLACRLGLEMLDVFNDENVLVHVREVGAYFRSQLEEIARIPVVNEVRGEGLMLALDLKVSARRLVGQLLEAGFITNCTNETVLRLLPPLTIRIKQIDKFIQALRPLLEKMGT